MPGTVTNGFYLTLKLQEIFVYSGILKENQSMLLKQESFQPLLRFDAAAMKSSSQLLRDTWKQKK